MAQKPWWEEQFYTQPVLGKRADFVYVDDVSIQEEVNKRYKEELRKKLEAWCLYGVDPSMKKDSVDVNEALMNELKRPSPMMSYVWSSGKKESEMEIGGNVCHLCGAKLLQHNCDITYKKRQHVRNVKRYECGTVVEKGYKSKGEGFVMEDPYSKVILGDDCVEI